MTFEDLLQVQYAQNARRETQLLSAQMIREFFAEVVISKNTKPNRYILLLKYNALGLTKKTLLI